jgi:hypothetical protein
MTLVGLIFLKGKAEGLGHVCMGLRLVVWSDVVRQFGYYQ